MSSKELYKRFVSLCKKWPLDPTKYDRDYGEYFRQQIKKEFPFDERSQVKDPVALESKISSLERLANNSYFNENRFKKCSASGIDARGCHAAVSTENLRLMQEQEESYLMMKLKKSLRVKYNKDDYLGKPPGKQAIQNVTVDENVDTRRITVSLRNKNDTIAQKSTIDNKKLDKKY